MTPEAFAAKCSETYTPMVDQVVTNPDTGNTRKIRVPGDPIPGLLQRADPDANQDRVDIGSGRVATTQQRLLLLAGEHRFPQGTVFVGPDGRRWTATDPAVPRTAPRRPCPYTAINVTRNTQTTTDQKETA